MATATAKKAVAKKAAAKKTPAKPPATNGHVLSDADLTTLKANLLADPDARAAFTDELALRNVVDTLVAKRNEKGISQGQLSPRIGTTQPTLSHVEGGRQTPNVAVLQHYARAMGMRLELRLV